MTTVAEEMAAILAQHEDCAFSASGVVVCSCGAALQPNEVMWDMSNLAAHQAEALAANGYGKLEDAKAAALREAALELMNVSEHDSRMPGIRFAVGFLAGQRGPE